MHEGGLDLCGLEKFPKTGPFVPIEANSGPMIIYKIHCTLLAWNGEMILRLSFNDSIHF